MMVRRLPAALCLLLLLVADSFVQGDDFDLSQALGGDQPTVKPAEKPQPAQPGGESTAFDLDEVLGGSAGVGVTEKKPTVKPQGGGGNGGFDLGDALGAGEETPTQKPRPAQPGQGGGGSFGDDDLADAAGGMPPCDPSGGDSRQHGRAMQPSSGGAEGGQGQGEEKQSVIAGVLGALGVAAVGAASSFFAYQKKKLCFKGQADDPENVNMEAHKGDQHDPQAQSSLLAK